VAGEVLAGDALDRGRGAALQPADLAMRMRCCASSRPSGSRTPISAAWNGPATGRGTGRRRTGSTSPPRVAVADERVDLANGWASRPMSSSSAQALLVAVGERPQVVVDLLGERRDDGARHQVVTVPLTAPADGTRRRARERDVRGALHATAVQGERQRVDVPHAL
jgi:hypothetical protein